MTVARVEWGGGGGGSGRKVDVLARGEGWCCARTNKLPQLPYSIIPLPCLGRLVIDLFQLFQDVLNDHRRPQARLLVNEGRWPQDRL